MSESKQQVDSVLCRVRESCKTWMDWDPNETTREQVRTLLASAENGNAGDLKILADRMLKRIAFGTAGLRALMAGGNACMNELVVMQTTQGLCEYMLEHLPDIATSKGVVIGYDGRYNSELFAHVTAAVFLSKGVPVHLYRKLVATPLVPYAVSHLKLAGGVMVTASHNPKDDNGYKVYWANGAQIIPPHDKGIAASIGANMKPWTEGHIELDMSHPKLHDPEDLIETYMKEIRETFCFHGDTNSSSNVRVTYTAMHGVGAPFVKRAFEVFGLPPYIPVREQIDPDPEFSTVKFPNPEEGKGALALSMKTAEREGSNLILANDPDADRLAVAEFDEKTHEWHIFNGNQIAALFADWVWKNHTKQHPDESAKQRKNNFMVASTVSSKFVKAIADREGFTFADTLTGFKWMGNAAYDMERRGMHFLFAYEVEIGFLIGSMSLDKDGVRTAASFTEMADQLSRQGVTLWNHLQSLYAKYGYYEMNTGYFFSYTNDPLNRVFKHLRTGGPDGGYVTHCGPHKIVRVRDVTTGYDSGRDDKKCAFLTMPDAHMITFYFGNGCVATLRNSGTEPKLKYYMECNDAESQSAARQMVDEMRDFIIKEFVEPDKNGLIAKKPS